MCSRRISYKCEGQSKLSVRAALPLLVEWEDELRRRWAASEPRWAALTASPSSSAAACRGATTKVASAAEMTAQHRHGRGKTNDEKSWAACGS